MLNFLIDRDKEEAFLDFKETIKIDKDSPFSKIAKDIFAFSNYGGGFILVGFKERKTKLDSNLESKRHFLPMGLSEDFHIDQADLQSKFNSYSENPINIDYHEFFTHIEGSEYKLAAIYIQPSTSILKPIKDGAYTDNKGKNKLAFRVGNVLFRRGTQSIIASKEEEQYIKKRAEKEGYKISVLSGNPDQVKETLYSNLFEVTKTPKFIWTAKTLNEFDEKERHIPYTETYTFWNKQLITFSDVSSKQCPLNGLVDLSSVEKHELSEWSEDSDKQRMVVYLLNKELRRLANRLELVQEEKRDKFYYFCEGEFRVVTWKPRFKASSSLKVAQRMWANQLKRFIFWHLAVIARFTYLGGKLFMRLEPTLLITDDGHMAIFGSKEGTIITRLIYNKYNSSYLNSLLFWISKFAEGKENFFLAQGKIEVSAKPSTTDVTMGILSDKPTAELMQEVPDIQLEEDE